MLSSNKAMTAEEFKASQMTHFELVKGKIVPLATCGGEHGVVELKLAWLLQSFLQLYKLGTAYAGEVGFVVARDPDTVRSPDLAFVSYERLAGPPKEFIPVAPDLAIEILSPGNTVTEMHAKVIDYLKSGTRLIWVVDPDTRSIMVYRSFSDIRVLTEGDTLEGGEILPGFSVEVKAIFE